MGVLDRILTQKHSELAELRTRKLPAPPPLRAVSLVRQESDPVRILAEIKRRSPSAGPLNTKLSVAERAAAYERAGATMASVLCDSHFFGGGYEHLTEARESSNIPLLCKEFIIDEAQLDCARAFGAEAALLIVRCLDDARLERLFAATRERGLLPLVEVASEQEAARALAVGASTIGVNARDLDTLEMDSERAARVLACLPKHITKLHLSGISRPADITKLRDGGIDGALIGEILMRQDDPEPLLRSLVVAGAAQNQGL
ncbi:MAG TPA: indole-3-glycerol phosphate synthase TrpC, partial [Polyangiaceae bacterium]|nr:indole-3-glycerol phosphate synthase TrpC [Polyangiaceae bacterium]